MENLREFSLKSFKFIFKLISLKPSFKFSIIFFIFLLKKSSGHNPKLAFKNFSYLFISSRAAWAVFAASSRAVFASTF